MKTFKTPPLISNHFAVYSDGHLHDHRNPNWASEAFRKDFKRTFSRPKNLAQVKATIRAGQFAWPGGYQLFLVTHDGEALCFACAIKEFRQIVWDYQQKCSTGWRIVACEANWEDTNCVCCHCSKPIPSCYGEDEEEA